MEQKQIQAIPDKFKEFRKVHLETEIQIEKLETFLKKEKNPHWVRSSKALLTIYWHCLDALEQKIENSEV